MIIRLHIHMIILVLTFQSFKLMGQVTPSHLTEKEWKIEKVDLPGIGSNYIFEDIVQDSFGFIWIGSAEGLIRYDGHRTKIYTHDSNNPNSLSSNDISRLLLMDDRCLWIGTYYNGLNCMDLNSGVITHYLDSTTIKEIIRDNMGHIWVGSEEAIYRFDPSKDFMQPSRYLLGDMGKGAVWSIVQDRNGTIWAGSGTNIIQYIPSIDSFQRYPLHDDDNPYGLFNAPVYSLLEDSRYNLWVGLSDGKVFQLDRHTSQLTPIELNLPTDRKPCISSIYEDLDQKIWIVTAGGGLFRIDPFTGEQMHLDSKLSEPQIPSDIAWTIYQSQDSVFWICTGKRGGVLYKLFETSPQLVNYSLNGLSSYSFLENRLSLNDQLWISSEDGIVLFDLRKGFQKRYSLDLLPSETKEQMIIHSLCQGPDSSLWAACLVESNESLNGIFNFDPIKEVFKFYPLLIDDAGIHTRTRFSTRIRDLEFDNSGRILVATLGAGLYLFDPEIEKFQKYSDFSNKSEGLFFTYISDLLKTNDGVIHIIGYETSIGFGRKSLSRIEHDSMVHLELPSIINVPSRRTFEGLFYAESEGIWLQSRRDGFIHIDAQNNVRQIVTSTNSDLLSQDIMTVIKDQEQFWIKGNNLIYRFDPVKGKITSNLIRCTNSEMPMDQFNFRKAHRLQDGTILFGADTGFLRLDPQLSNQSISAKVAFSSLQIIEKKNDDFNRSNDRLNSLQSISLKHDENSFIINFFIPDYREIENNLYEFKLDNYDDDWQYRVSTPEAVYRKLPPGNYHFRVRAKGYRYSDAIESSIHLQILPPWYWAWWSKSLYFILLVSLIYWIYRYQLKRQLAIAEANRLKELDTFKTRLYTNITHEFRTPLTVILGWADQLEDKVIASGKEGLQMIRRNGDRLLNLVNQMLELQKLEAGSMPVHLVQDDIIPFLRYLVESFSSLANSKNIDIRLHAVPESIVMDYDPDKMQHIISNLVSNAIKFTNAGGFVEITFKQDSDSQLTINVRDNGIGISEEKLPHIFDRFFQADDSSVRQREGTGIGLSLTRELVLLLGGQISVKSISGAGSEFKVILPITHNAPAISPVLKDIKTPEVLPKSTPRNDNQILNKDLPQILIIEDNPDVVKYVLSVLQNAYQISTAADGQKGLNIAFESIPDLIISDVMMPKMNGYEVCDALKKDTRTSHIPIILLTAKADIESKLEGLEYGADAYLTKPFIKDELLVRIKSLLTQKERLQTHYKQLFGVVDNAEYPRADIAISAPENEFVVRVKTTIENHLDDSTFGVDQLCHAMAMSNSQLYRKLKAQTGLSAHDIIQSLRLSQAKSLLQLTDKNIAEIAYDCGFADPQYFSRVFKKEMGSSPSAFRNS